MRSKIILLLGFACVAGIQAAFAMPCDKSYICTAQSGKYQIELQACRYENRLNLLQVKRNSSIIKNATLGAAYDGAYQDDQSGRGPVDFEIKLPRSAEEDDSSQRILVIEIPADVNSSGMKGSIKEKFASYEPGSYKTVYQEPVSCQISD